MPDVSGLPRITAALKAAGYSDADVAKIWSGNLLRVLEQVQRQAPPLQGEGDRAR
jgi:membrane dipeptidase